MNTDIKKKLIKTHLYKAIARKLVDIEYAKSARNFRNPVLEENRKNNMGGKNQVQRNIQINL